MTYGLRGSAHAHCQFCDFRLKSPSILETVGYEIGSWLLWNVK